MWPFCTARDRGTPSWGIDAGVSTTTGADNTAVGDHALETNVTSCCNTAVGKDALTGTTAGFNTAVGYQAMRFNTTGIENTAVGHHAIDLNTIGIGNTAVGGDALRASNGSNNTAVGIDALTNLTLGSVNAALGAFALDNITSGSNSNTALGFNAGANLTNGDNNLYLDNAGVAIESGTIRIGDNQSQTFIQGIHGNTVSGGISVFVTSAGELGTISSSRRYKEDIHDMGDASRRLLQMRPVTFRYTQAFSGGVKPVQYGLIAEEVADVFPELAVLNADGQPETVKYQDLSVLLLNELQRLTEQQRRERSESQRRLETLERQVADLLKRLE